MSRRPRTLLAAIVAGVLLAPAALAVADPAAAVGFRRGPAPTAAGIVAAQGPFAVATVAIADSASPDFGAAVVSYPTTTAAGKFGVVAMAPGFTESRAAVDWLRPRLASQGFVVVALDTNFFLDLPDNRGRQLLAALDYVVTLPAVARHADATREAVIGHSMGGGATLEASNLRTSLKAAVGLEPWDLTTGWGGVVTPSLEIGAQNDFIAPPASHAIPFYNQLPATTNKAYLELAGADHFVSNSANPVIQAATLAWLKRYVDNDTRYRKFLCPGPAVTGPVSAFRTNAC